MHKIEDVGATTDRKCNFCEFGLENPDHYMQSVGLTCNEAKNSTQNDPVKHANAEECRRNAVFYENSGCKCLEEVVDNLQNEQKF